MKNSMLFHICAVVPLALLFGCLGAHGKLELQSEYAEMATMTQLEEDWDQYTIYYTDYWPGKPAAIMFDPQDDNKSLVSSSWTPIESRERVSEVVSWIKRGKPKMYRISGPDGEFYGFMYSTREHVVMKQIDPRTLEVFDFPPPPSPR